MGRLRGGIGLIVEKAGNRWSIDGGVPYTIARGGARSPTTFSEIKVRHLWHIEVVSVADGLFVSENSYAQPRQRPYLPLT